jgi:hypothetical protein
MGRKKATTPSKEVSDNQYVSQEEDETTAVCIPSLITSQLIAEEIFLPGEAPYFAIRRFGSEEIEKVSEVEDEEHRVVYRPLDNPTLRKRLVLLPDAAIPCTFSEAYAKGCELALKMYDASPDQVPHIKFLVAVTQSSYFLDRFFPNPLRAIPGAGAFAPIVSIRGPSGHGKDRLLNALRFNSHRPFFDMSTRRVPSLFRPLDQWRGTLCLDECDLGHGDEASEVTKYLNGRAYGVPYSRQNPDAVRNNDVFYNFGLTIVTQRRAWEDNATEDRTLPFYCRKSLNPIPTEETDEWLLEGTELMNMLTWLRLRYYDKVELDKAARIEGLVDHRLTAAVLPLLALSRVEPSYRDESLLTTLKAMEATRRRVKAQSKDGVIVNALWDRLTDGLFDTHDGFYFAGKEKAKGLDREDAVIPLSTSDLADQLKWKAKEVRSVLHSLQIAPIEAPQQARIAGMKSRPIYFEPSRLEQHFADFVVDYSADKFTELGFLQRKLSVPVPDVPIVLDDTPHLLEGPEAHQDGVPHITSGTTGTTGTASKGEAEA